jgi:hypothetical protein
VTTLDELKKQYERKMKAGDLYTSDQVYEDLQTKIAPKYSRKLLPEDPNHLSQIMNVEGGDGMKRDVPQLALRMNYINKR